MGGVRAPLALIRASGVRVDHAGDDRAHYSLEDGCVVLPDGSPVDSQSGYTYTAVHELGHAPDPRTV